MQTMNCYKCGKEVRYSNGGRKKRVAKSRILCYDCEMKKVARKMAKIRKALDKEEKV